MNNVRLSEMSKKRSNKKVKYELMLHNDDNVTFQHVMDCLVDICGHNELQANQCALITHNNGKCSVFVDDQDECELIYELLIKNGLTVTMKTYKKR